MPCGAPYFSSYIEYILSRTPRRQMSFAAIGAHGAPPMFACSKEEAARGICGIRCRTEACIPRRGTEHGLQDSETSLSVSLRTYHFRVCGESRRELTRLRARRRADISNQTWGAVSASRVAHPCGGSNSLLNIDQDQSTVHTHTHIPPLYVVGHGT